MAIQDRTQVGQPVTAAPVLPFKYPSAPEKLLKAFPGFEDYQAEQEALYKRIRESLTTSHQSLALPIEVNQNKIRSLDKYIQALLADGTIGGWYAAVQTEQAARVAEDGLLATRIDTVETSMGDALSVAVTSEATARINADGALGIRIDDVITTVGGVSAAVTAEASARATADGFLSGNYTLRVSAGNVVTGMSITSSVAANGGTTSDITFQASSFKIYDGSSAQAVFTAAGGVVTINGSLIAPGTVGNSLFDTATTSKLSQLGVTGLYSGTIAANQVVAASLTAISATLGTAIVGTNGHLRQGQTAYNTGTGFWIGDVSGTPKFSLGNSSGNRLTWDGTTLSIVGSITLTNSIPAASVSGLAAVATSGTLAASSVTGLAAVATSGTLAAANVTGLASVATGGSLAANLVTGLAAVATGGTLAASSVTGLASVATSGLYSALTGTPNTTYIDGSGIYTGTLIANQILAGLVSVASLSAIKAEVGNLVITTSGSIRSGQTAFDTGTGFWLGTVASTPKFSIGNSGGNKLTWDGSALAITATQVNLGRLSIKSTSNPWDNSAVLTVSKVYAPTLTPVALGSYAGSGGSTVYDRGILCLEGYAVILGNTYYSRLTAYPAVLEWRTASTYAGLPSAARTEIVAGSDGLSIHTDGTERFRVSPTEVRVFGTVAFQGSSVTGTLSRTASALTLSDPSRTDIAAGSNQLIVYPTYTYTANMLAAAAIGVSPVGSTSTDVVRAQKLRTDVVSLSGGTTQDVNIDLSGYAFGAKPTVGLVQLQGYANVKVYYNFDAAGSTATNAVITFAAISGQTLPSGYVRIFYQFHYIA